MGLTIMDVLTEILKKDSFFDVVFDVALFAAPLWIAVSVGLVVGWVWKPTWAVEYINEKIGNFDGNGIILKLDSFKHFVGYTEKKEAEISVDMKESEGLAVNSVDLKHLYQLVEVSDGGPVWHQVMDKCMPGFSYRAWKREPETGPPQYRSSTIFDNATPEVVKDFFWDDEFRIKNKWDDMLLDHTMLEKCTKTGTMVVRWVRKFPFFCSAREYIVGRRIWDADGTYYCITKGVPRPAIPRHSKPRRVDLYYSSWCVRAVESRKGDGKKTACEVLLFHHEDMGIPWEIAKLGVKQGMWGCVKKIEPGLRAYQTAKTEKQPLSEYATMARINTKVSFDYLKHLEQSNSKEDLLDEIVEAKKPKNWGRFILVGGAVVAACTLDRGLLTKAVLFGFARRFGRIGR